VKQQKQGQWMKTVEAASNRLKREKKGWMGGQWKGGRGRVGSRPGDAYHPLVKGVALTDA